MTAPRLIVLGSVNADHVLQVDRFPRPGETVTGHGYRVIPGGKGANQAVAAARLGADIGFIACVGDDDFGSRMIERFKEDNIVTTGVMTVPDTPTGLAMIQVAASGENSIAIAAEANAHLTPDAFSGHRRLVTGADMLLMQLESPLETIEAAARTARENGTKVILNPAPAQPLPDSLLAELTIITPNETEAEELTGIRVETAADAQAAADFLHDKGVETVILTLGERGAYLSSGQTRRLIAGFSVSPVDTTAAGDTFNGALAAAMQRGDAVPDAISFAHAAAAISVTRMGAQTSIPYRNEVDEFISANT